VVLESKCTDDGSHKLICEHLYIAMAGFFVQSARRTQNLRKENAAHVSTKISRDKVIGGNRYLFRTFRKMISPGATVVSIG
jgi:hypothetical protein